MAAPASRDGPPARLHSAKVVVLGDAGVGKTSLLNRYVNDTFSSNYKSTIGANFLSHSYQVSPTESVTLSLWDTAGQERFRSLGMHFYRGADAVVLVFSILDRNTLEHVASWVSEFKQRCPVEDGYEDTITWICIGNKLDQAGSPQPNEEVQPVTLQEAQGVLDKIIPSDELAPAASDAGLASGEVTPMPVENNPASNPSASEVQSEGTMNGIAQSAQNIHLPNTNNVPFPSVNGPKGLTNGLPSSIDIERTKAKLKNKSSRSTIARSRERESSKASVYHTPAGSISGSGWTQHLAQQQLYQSNGPSSLGSSTHTLTLASPPRFGTAYLPEDSEEPRSAGTSQTPSQVNGKLELPPLTPPVDSMSDTSTVHANGQSEAALEAELTNGVIQASTPCEVAQEGNEEGEDDMVEAPPWHGIRLFYASAKSGLGVEEAFDYVARHIYERLQYDERQRQNSHNDQSKGPFGLSNVQLGNKDQSGAVHVDRNGAREGKGWKSACCG